MKAFVQHFRNVVEVNRTDLYEVAENSTTPPEVLTQLAADENVRWGIRAAVARNPSAPVEALSILSKDEESSNVRGNVTRNPNVPLELLMNLMEDHKHWVRRDASQHPVFLQHRAEQDGICEVGQQMPVEWLREMYLT